MTSPKAFTRVSHLFLLTTALALFCASLRDKWMLATVRMQNDKLTCELQAAKLDHIPAARDPVALAIRNLASSSLTCRDELRSLIACWGELEYSKQSVSLKAGVPAEIEVFHARDPANSAIAGATHNCTIAILLDDAGNVIDTTSYASDLNEEWHLLNTGRGLVSVPGTDLASSPNDEDPYILISRQNADDSAFKDYLKVVMTPDGFVQAVVSASEVRSRLAGFQKVAEHAEEPKPQ